MSVQTVNAKCGIMQTTSSILGAGGLHEQSLGYIDILSRTISYILAGRWRSSPKSISRLALKPGEGEIKRKGLVAVLVMRR